MRTPATVGTSSGRKFHVRLAITLTSRVGVFATDVTELHNIEIIQSVSCSSPSVMSFSSVDLGVADARYPE